jgi:hypothetical protein
MFLSQLAESLKETYLRFEIMLRAIKPKTLSTGPAMHPEWPPDSVAEFVCRKLILARENLYTFRVASCLDRHTQPSREIVEIESAFTGEKRLSTQYPEMRTSAGPFESRLYKILLELNLDLQQMRECSTIVCVDSDPF